MTARLLRESPPEGDTVTLHHEVEIGHARDGLGTDTAEEEIPDEAADRVDGLSLRFRELARCAQEPQPCFFLGAMNALELHGEGGSLRW